MQHFQRAYVAVAFGGAAVGTLLINQRCCLWSSAAASLERSGTGFSWDDNFWTALQPKTRKYLDDSYPEIEICSSIALMCPLLKSNLVFHINNHLSSSLQDLPSIVLNSTKFEIYGHNNFWLSVSTQRDLNMYM